ncbi:NAD(P)H-hydrate dehydratase [Miltoncostaea oceani]|uniref:NAD(P)H-hydrate dehydratase n=1 Tax=Miltoncostaea oceani TaxID=2843216 RepID=UPI001C3CE46C|nr:NAD(P)H-hydrate dehydratase [Miltoncostaea oceani]
MAAASHPSRPPVPGCTPLFDAEAMRQADRAASEDHGIPSVVLMERAGLAAAREIEAAWPDARSADILVGPGNNGGDGMVVARHLAEAGWRVRVAAPGGRAPATPDAALMTRIAATLGIDVAPFDPAAPHDAAAVAVDALLGTGATGAPHGPLGAAVEWLAAHPGPVVALDVPSGVEADTGRVAGAAVRADLTVTFHGDMTGLHVAPGLGRSGRVVVVDIGIPRLVAPPPAAWLAPRAVIAAIPAKGAASDKYASGSVLVVAGSPGLTGAAALAASSALRAGAGLVVAAVPAGVQPLVAAHLLEVMCAPVPDEDGHLAPSSVDAVLGEARRASAVAIGPGLGRAAATTAAVEALIDVLAPPVVIDADGLWHLGDAPERVAGRRGPTVLTPHAGEAARLLGRPRADVEADRLACARELAARAGAVVVLKGAGTITAAPDGTAVVTDGGTAALATAGTGDVLTGAVAAALAKGMDPLPAAVAAVAAHARAGELADRGDGTIASDVRDALPRAIAGEHG